MVSRQLCGRRGSTPACLTGIVSVADDGGSSGRLRRQLGIVPPGDLRTVSGGAGRRLLRAVRSLAEAFEHRFDADEARRSRPRQPRHRRPGCIHGRPAAGPGRSPACMLGTVGRVLPSGHRARGLEGERRVRRGQGPDRRPEDTGHRAGLAHPLPTYRPRPRHSTAIADADQVVIGPGSLYTSVLAALAVPEHHESPGARCTAHRVYVANLQTAACGDRRLRRRGPCRRPHGHGVPIDMVVADTSAIALGDIEGLGVRVVMAELAKTNGLAHDPGRLADVLADLVA